MDPQTELLDTLMRQAAGLPAVRVLPPDPRPSLYFDTEGRECDAQDRSVEWRGDPDGWVMQNPDRVSADEPSYGWRPETTVDVLARVVETMRARGYVPRP